MSFTMPGWEMMPNYHCNWDDWWSRSWCWVTVPCSNQRSHMGTCCPSEHSAAAGQLGWHQLCLPAKGWLTVLPVLCSLPWWTADCRVCKTWRGSQLLLGSSVQSQLAWQKNWISMVCYRWMTLFKTTHQVLLFFQTLTLAQIFVFLLAGICVSAQKLSRFAGWLELSCCFLNCCFLQPVLVEENFVCAALLVFVEVSGGLMLAWCQMPTEDTLSLLR